MLWTNDFVINEGGTLRGVGPIGELVADIRGDPGLARPYWNEQGKPAVTINTGRKRREVRKDPVSGIELAHYVPIHEEVLLKDLRDLGVELPTNNATSLRKEEWLYYDSRVIPPQRKRLRIYRDMSKVELFTFDGMANSIIEHETMSDPGRAYADMDMLSEGTNDTPLFQLEGVPVPIMHAGFSVDLRKLTQSRKRGIPLSTRGIDWATQRVLELVEQMGLGVVVGNVYGGLSTQQGGYSRTAAVYGMITFPSRLTKTDLTVPLGTNPEATVTDVMEMRQQLYDANFHGPYGIYHSTDWDTFLDSDYAFTNATGWAVNPTMTLRQRLLAIGTEGGEPDAEKQIRWVKRADWLTPANSHAFTMIMVHLESNVVRAVQGMPITVFQYERRGGWEQCFRVAGMLMLEFFADYSGNCGLLHARTA